MRKIHLTLLNSLIGACTKLTTSPEDTGEVVYQSGRIVAAAQGGSPLMMKDCGTLLRITDLFKVCMQEGFNLPLVEELIKRREVVPYEGDSRRHFQAAHDFVEQIAFRPEITKVLEVLPVLMNNDEHLDLALKRTVAHVISGLFPPCMSKKGVPIERVDPVKRAILYSPATGVFTTIYHETWCDDFTTYVMYDDEIVDVVMRMIPTEKARRELLKDPLAYLFNKFENKLWTPKITERIMKDKPNSASFIDPPRWVFAHLTQMYLDGSQASMYPIIGTSAPVVRNKATEAAYAAMKVVRSIQSVHIVYERAGKKSQPVIIENKRHKKNHDTGTESSTGSGDSGHRL